MPRRNSIDIPGLATLLGGQRVGNEFEQADTESQEKKIAEAVVDSLGPAPDEDYQPSAEKTVVGTDYSEVEWVEAINQLRATIEEVSSSVDRHEVEIDRIFERTVGSSGTDRMMNKLAMKLHETYADQGKATLRQLTSTLVGLTEMWAHHSANEWEQEATGPVDVVDIDVTQWEKETDNIDDRREEVGQKLDRVSERTVGAEDGTFLPEQEEKLRQVEKVDRADEAGVSPQPDSSGSDKETLQPSSDTSTRSSGSSGSDAEESTAEPMLDGEGIPSPAEIMDRVSDRGDADD